MKKLSYILLLLLLWASIGWAENHWVIDGTCVETPSCDGSTYNRAFSWADAQSAGNWSPNNSDDNLIGPGDTVYFSGAFAINMSGAADALWVRQSGDDDDNRIIFDGNDGTNPAATFTLSAGGGDNEYFVANGAYDYFTIRNFTIRSSGNSNHALYIGSGAQYINIHNNDFSAAALHGLYAYHASYINFYNNLWVSTRSNTSASGEGLWLAGCHDITIYNNVFSDWTHNAISGNSHGAFPSYNIEVYYNYFSMINNGYGRGFGFSGAWDGDGTTTTYDISVHHNLFIDMRAQNQFQTVRNVRLFQNIHRNFRNCCSATLGDYECVRNADSCNATQAQYGSSAGQMIQSQTSASSTEDVWVALFVNNTFSDIAESAFSINDNEAEDINHVVVVNNAMTDVGNCVADSNNPFCSTSAYPDRSIYGWPGSGNHQYTVVLNNLMNSGFASEIVWPGSDVARYYTVNGFHIDNPVAPDGVIEKSGNYEGAPGFKSATELYPDSLSDYVVGNGIDLSPDFLAYSSCAAAYLMTGNGDVGETDICTGDSTSDNLTNSGVISTSTVPTGYTGTSRQFDESSSEYLYLADSGSPEYDFTGNQSFTIASWYYGDTEANWNSMIQKWSPDEQYQLTYENTTDHFRCSVRNSADTATTSADSVTEVNTATWYHVACVHDADRDTLTIYVNGRYEAQSAHSTGINDSGSNLEIGRRGAGYYMDGKLAHVALFSEALNPLEIFQLYAFGLAGDMELSGYETLDDFIHPISDFGSGSSVPNVVLVDQDDIVQDFIGAYALTWGYDGQYNVHPGECYDSTGKPFACIPGY